MTTISEISKQGLRAGGLKDSDFKNGKLIKEVVGKIDFKLKKSNLKVNRRLKY
ncbi:MAG TPA: hypothetical protein VGA29_07585 [Ignavibacteriaceae bacterium]